MSAGRAANFRGPEEKVIGVCFGDEREATTFLHANGKGK